jgi:hypothetical protein
MNEVLIGIHTLLLFIAIHLVYQLFIFYKEKNIFKAVKWCGYYDSFFKERPEVRMRDHIVRLQHELSLDTRYRITIDEKDAVDEILLRFRQDVIQEYFSGYYQKLGFSFETNLQYYLEKHKYEYEYRYNITYHKVYYILQLHYLRLHNIVDDHKLGVINANQTKATIDNLLK